MFTVLFKNSSNKKINVQCFSQIDDTSDDLSNEIYFDIESVVDEEDLIEDFDEEEVEYVKKKKRNDNYLDRY